MVRGHGLGISVTYEDLSDSRFVGDELKQFAERRRREVERYASSVTSFERETTDRYDSYWLRYIAHRVDVIERIMITTFGETKYGVRVEASVGESNPHIPPQDQETVLRSFEPGAAPIPRPYVCGQHGPNPGLASDCETLLAARDTLAGNATLNWSADRPIVQWDGIVVEGTPLRVTRVDLGEWGLTGTIPPELGSLASLELLALNSNRLSGSMPVEIGSLAALQVLDLGGNELSGEIPSELGNLANLRTVHIPRNDLTGAIPSELGKLSNLESLSLYGNQLTGPIPSQLGSLSNLRWLYLSDNQLTGAIPAELGSLANLTGLWLGSNQLTGAIPAELGSLDKLEHLWLSGNRLSGCIPAGLRDVGDDDPGNDPDNDLDRLGLPFCDMLPTPTLTPTPALTPTPTPTSTPTPTPTPAVRVGCGSAVSDTSNLGLVADCETLLGMKDVLRGSAALNWSDSLPITRWDGVALGGSPSRVIKLKLNRQKERLDGHIPAEIGELAMLEELWLHNNRLSGTLPLELGDLGNLNWLFLSNNKLSGQIPENLNKLELDRFWIHKNDFTGCVPYNLTLTREYKADTGLPACAPPSGSPTPTPTPTPLCDANALCGDAHPNCDSDAHPNTHGSA